MLFLVGSGPSEHLDEVHDQFVEAARRRGGPIAVAALGTEEEVEQFLPDYVQPILTRWPDAVIEPVFLDDDGDTVWPDDLRALAGLVVCGGWTPGYLDALTPQRDTISRLVRGGMPYLGFSAGAMIVSRHAIVGGWKYQGRMIAPEIVGEGLEELTIRDGLALIGPCVETHADAWSNLGVALAALEACPARTAVTIDEGTCLAVDPASGRTNVIGAGRVYWLQKEGAHVMVSHEQAPPPPPAEPPALEHPVAVKPSQLPKHVPPHSATPTEPEQAEGAGEPDQPASGQGTESGEPVPGE